MQNNTSYSNIHPVSNIVNNTANVIQEGESIFNKTCNEVSNRLIAETNVFNKNPILLTNDVLQNNQLITPVQHAGNVENPVNAGNLVGIELITTNTNSNPTKSKYYLILGYEISIWTLILILLILITIIYFIYKWFFSYDNKIVSIKKSKQIIKSITLKDKEKLNQEISDSENSNSDSDSDSDSESNSTLSSKSKSSLKNSKTPKINKK
jgi:hypothetical protein